MYAPSARSKLDALRAELAQVWSAREFDRGRNAEILAAIERELTALRPPGYIAPEERKFVASQRGGLVLQERKRKRRMEHVS